MRALAGFGLLLLAACGSDGQASAPAPKPDAPRPADPFLAHLPGDAAIVARLPAGADLEERAEEFSQLSRMLGLGPDPQAAFLGAGDAPGLDPAAGPGFALGLDGSWTHYLPAADKGALNTVLRNRAGVSLRELDPYVVVFRGGQGPSDRATPPLPPGDLALRVTAHPLLATVAGAGDVLEASVTAGGGGLRFRGRLLPGEATETAACLAEAVPGEGGTIELLPPTLVLRVETTLPPAMLAGFLARHLARHAGFGEERDRDLVERFLREVLTGAAPGFAFGIEIKEGDLTVVAAGRRSPGPDSPILARVRADSRSAFGPLVLDRREAPATVLGWVAWVAQAEPNLDGLPEVTVPLVGRLVREDEGLDVAYAEWQDWFVLGLGARADLLARAVRARIARGATRDEAGFDLVYLRDDHLRETGGGDYVLGVIFQGSGLADLPSLDREALSRMFFVGKDATRPSSLVVTGFRHEGQMALRARLRY